ncbi:MAG: 2-C-methyl-D-erythritol 4-phosphate cytidylyltransferase [Geminicoccaceae bacterium]|nr:MAG: 2-C-methyl-D-erythritol 4-phosphate cytidylyltransferase [Geminicoccaceae bacterium]
MDGTAGGTFAVVVGAGSGTRFGGRPKQYRPLGGVPVFRRALMAFAGHPRIDGVLAVIGADAEAPFRQVAAGLDLLPPVIGGAERTASVQAALDALAPYRPAHVLIHDAARPLVPRAVIDRVLDGLTRFDAVIPALPVRDTLKRTVAGMVTGTVPRDGLAAVQTPQGFDYRLLRDAYAQAGGAAATDDATLVERLGLAVHVVEGDPLAMKITDPNDLDQAERLLGNPMGTRPLLPRVGTGFDVHRLGPGAGVVIGGLTIPCPLALIGHSDADVGLHALTDAILGTLGDGDIGTLFPPSDMQWQGADSAIFIQEACRRVRARGGVLHHLDLTILCERPKIGPHREAMRARIALICELEVAQVSVKATTTEKLGFTGRGEGIAAQAAATVLLPS